MGYFPTPSEEEIADQLNIAIEQGEGGSKWPGMSYELGVQNALRWVLGDDDVKPMDD